MEQDNKENKEECSENLEELAINILSAYDCNIDNLINEQDPDEIDEPYVVFIMNSGEKFIRENIHKETHFNFEDQNDLNFQGRISQATEAAKNELANKSKESVESRDNEESLLINENEDNELTKLKEPLINKIKRTETVAELEEKEKMYIRWLTIAFETSEMARHKALVEEIVKVYKSEIKKRNSNEKQSEEESNQKVEQNNQLKQNDYLDYEGFILIFSCLIKYYSQTMKNILVDEDINKQKKSLSVSIRFFDSKDKIMLLISGAASYENEEATTEDCFDYLAEAFDYPLQLKPFAKFYEKMKEENKNLNTENILNSRLEDEQFVNLNFNDVKDFPPYFAYDKTLDKRIFRKYKLDDSFINEINIKEEEERNGEPIKVSKYRNIDKLRLIHMSLNYILRFNYLVNQNIVDYFFYNRNNRPYQKHFPNSRERFFGFFHSNVLNIFNTFEWKKRINFLRNYFCEEVAFYFVWLDYFCISLIFPSIIGIILAYFRNYGMDDTLTLSNTEEILLILFSITITIWEILFYKIWLSNEKFYSYCWGTDKSTISASKQYDDKFRPTSREILIFNIRVLEDYSIITKLKKIITYIFLFAMISVVIICTYFVFKLKKLLSFYSTKSTAIAAIINAIMIKIFRSIYQYAAEKLNDIENYKTSQTKEDALTFKYILFEFMNNYSSLFYIAFFKQHREGCIDNDCTAEIKSTVYFYFLTFFLYFFIEIGYPIFSFYHLSGLSKDTQFKAESKEQKKERKKIEKKMKKEEQKKEEEKNNMLEIELSQTTQTQEKKDEQKNKEKKSLGKKIIKGTKALKNEIKRKIKNKRASKWNTGFIVQGTIHLLNLDGVTNMYGEYYDMIILYGHVAFFSGCAPLTPVLVFIYVYIARLIDNFKFAMLNRVDFLDVSKGIRKYNNVILFFTFFGSMVNLGIILYNNKVDKYAYKKETLGNWGIFCIIENILIILMIYVDWNHLPDWFHNLNLIREGYEKKIVYYQRKNEKVKTE